MLLVRAVQRPVKEKANPPYTSHRFIFQDAGRLRELAAESIDLVVTSPPYPMIQMWDEHFSRADARVALGLEKGDGDTAFELMHRQLDRVWEELARVMKKGSFVCINIGDATRRIGNRFQLFANHARVLSKFSRLGFDPLPLILWRKQVNAPNKFMGSGMLPAGAYVTLEHEYILIFRKGPRRTFPSAEEKERRRQSALFWEERNVWYSDLWDFKGTRQNTGGEGVRERSAAYPLVLPFRLINMYSLLGDTVLDPFLGTGTTALAALAAGRNSIGFELEASFSRTIRERMQREFSLLAELNRRRVADHLAFIKKCRQEGRSLKYRNEPFGFPVMTGQETGLKLPFLRRLEEEEAGLWKAYYHDDAYLKEVALRCTP